MPKRAKKEASATATMEPIVLTPEDQAAVAADAAAVLSVEERLAALEAQLSEAQALNLRQAAVIVMGAENAESLAKSRKRGKNLEARMNETKKDAKSAKQAYEAWVEEHFALEETLSSGQQRLPYPPPEQGGVSRVEPVKPEPTADLETDDSWRIVPLGNLDLAESIVSKLIDASICTMGDLSDYQLPGPTGYVKRLNDIPGIGEASAEKILEAAAAFWATWAFDRQKDLEAETLAAVEATEAERDGEWEESEDPDYSEDEFNSDPVTSGDYQETEES